MDSTFLQVFDFPLQWGDRKSALAGKYNIVITESMASKYFGDSNPLGKTLKVSLNTLSGDFTVTGVLKRLPLNSHIQFDFLVPMEFLIQSYGPYKSGGGWTWRDFVTYITINENTNLDTVGEKLEQLITTYKGKELAQTNSTWKIGFQPITDIHLKSDFPKDLAYNNGDIQNVRYFSLIAIFILLMAWVNYVNLSTAHAIQRAKEVGVRKALGAFRKQLISQFIIESFLINSVAATLSIGIAYFMLPFLNHIIGKELAFNISENIEFWGGFLLIIMLGTLLSGLYPAFVLSSFRPVSIFKSARAIPTGGFSLRRVLIVFQFLTSIFLISGTYLVYKQITFMKNQDLGFDIEKILVINGPRVILEKEDRPTQVSKYQTFKQEASRYHSIASVTGSSNVPGRGSTMTLGVWRLGDPGETSKEGNFVFVDADFTQTYDLELLAGQPFTEKMLEWTGAIINEETVKAFKLGSPEKALGEKLVIYWGGTDTVEVLGVVKDIYWNSLRDNQMPLLFFPDKNYNVFFSAKINVSDIQESIHHLEAAYKSAFPNDPFVYTFLDDEFNRQYQADLQFGNLFSAFSLLAIFIACIGLFALVSFSATLRIKEIGIRKVLGASVSHLMVLLSREYLILLFIASLLAVPAIVIGGKTWLENYAYKVGIGWNLLLIPGLILLVIALVTVSYRTFAAARANPVESLKTE